MRLFSSLYFLFYYFSSVNSDHGKLALQDLYYGASVTGSLNKLLLKFRLLNDEVNPLELAQQVMGKRFDESKLKPYSEMDISNGLKDQNEILELVDKVNAVEIQSQSHQTIKDGLEKLEKLEILSSKIDIASERPHAEIDLIEARSKVPFDHNKTRFGAEPLIPQFGGLLFLVSSVAGDILEGKPITQDMINNLWIDLKIAIPFMKDFELNFINLFAMLEEIGILDELYRFEPLAYLKVAIQEYEDHKENIKTLALLPVDLDKIEDEMDLLMKLRDTQSLANMMNVLHSLQDNSKFEDYQNNKLVEYLEPELLKKILAETSRLTGFDWSIQTFTSKLKEFENIKKKLEGISSKIPSGEFKDHFSQLRSCIDLVKNHTDFSNEKSEIEILEKKFKEIKAAHDDFLFLVNKTRSFQNLYLPIFNAWKKIYEEDSDFSKELKDNKEIYYGSQAELENDVKEYFDTVFHGEPKPPGRNLSTVYNYEGYAYRIHDLLGKLDYQSVRKIIDETNKKLEESRKFLTCYSTLKAAHSDLKSRIEQLLEVSIKEWSFDPRFLEKSVESVYLLKQTYRSIQKLKKWKFDEDDKVKNFPLKSENIEVIKDGLNAVNSILKAHETWEEKLLGAPDDIQGFWVAVNSELQKLKDVLSHMESGSDLARIISDVSFPSGLQFDPIINFVKTVYPGRRMKKLLNFLESAKDMMTNFSAYPDKIRKMNESMDKLNKWREEYETSDDSEGVCDCFESLSMSCESSCQAALRAGTSN